MKIAFLTCDDLSTYVVDDNYLFDAIKTDWPALSFDVISWSDPSIDWSKYDAAILRTTWDYTKNRDKFLNRISRIENAGCKIFNPLDIIKWNSHKSYLRDLKKSGISIIESHFLDEENSTTLNDKLNDDVDYVLKPIVGASADSIQILNKKNLLCKIENLENPSAWFVQPFMAEIFEGERSIFYFNSVFSHACKKVPKAGDFRVQEEHGGLITAYQVEGHEIEFSELVLKAIGKNLLYCRIDFIKTAAGPQLIELELIEPSLYFRTDVKSVTNFIQALKQI